MALICVTCITTRGIVSAEESPREQPSFDWLLWLKWVLASTLGWVAGVLLPITGTFAVGATVGIAQWVVLRPIFKGAGWWIPASALGWAIGQILIMAVPIPNTFLQGAVLGGTLGIAQWLVLRRWVHRAGWWIVLSAVGWSAGPVLGASLVGAVAGATTGFALELFVRYARSTEELTQRR
jgi:hypothetical protein